jgi:hypothetical protein
MNREIKTWEISLLPVQPVPSKHWVKYPRGKKLYNKVIRKFISPLLSVLKVKAKVIPS